MIRIKTFRITTLLLIAGFFYTTTARAQFYFGGGMKFNNNSGFKALGLNAKGAYGFNEKFDINVDATYYIAAKASWSFDFDFQYRLFNISEKVFVRPFAGLNFLRTTITENSLSLGASLRVPAEKYTYYVEPRWILDGSMFVFSAGITYPVIER
jgi:hypothetical protein